MTIYTDVDGNRSERPPDATPVWRTSCYAIVRRGDRILMSKPAGFERWELPGGGVETAVDASLIDAVVRECYEETGYRLSPIPGTLRFCGEAHVRGRTSGTFMTILPFFVEGTVGDGQDPAWLARPIEDVSVAWVDPATLTLANAYWFHLNGLRSLGILTSPPQSPHEGHR